MSNTDTTDANPAPAPAPSPAPRPAPSPDRRRRRLPNFGLSATQLVATALAAVTATFAASYFGVAGTVIGAALVSVVTAAGKEVYGQSLRSTGSRVRAVVPVTRSLPVVGRATPDDAGEGEEAEEADEPPVLPRPRPRPDVPARQWRRVAIGTMAVFVAVLAVITGVEIVAGRPVSDIVRGESGAGTSFFGTAQVRTKTVPPTAPTVTMTVTPKVVVTTPTVTQTAPASTATTTPTTTAPSTAANRPGTTSSTTTSPTRSTGRSGAATSPAP